MYKTGQVVLVKFHPSYGSEIKKYRPAVVISEVTERVDNRFVLIAPLTTKKSRKKNLLEVPLKDVAFLKQKSYALLWYPLTIDNQRVQHVLGSLPDKATKTMQTRLRKMFN